MVNIGFGLAQVLGLLDILVSIAYTILSIRVLFAQLSQANANFRTAIGVIALSCCPPALFLSGVILFFNGWRLDPILMIEQLLLHAIVAIFVAKEIVDIANM